MKGLLPATLILAAGSVLSGAARGTKIREPAACAKEREFVDLVRESTARYRDRARAVADGYRLIGRDFPGMGEHWIHVGLLFDGVYDPARPEFLSYVTVEGKPTLLGVAYGLPLLAGESPPEGPAGRAAWHDHVGTLDEETLLPHHHLSGHAGHGPRLAMVHAWVWLDNPDGLFAADNWSIPFARLGLEPPRAPAHAAAKALSLLTGGDGYVADVVTKAQGATEPSPPVLEALRRARGGVEALLHGRSRRALGPGEIEALGALWDGLWSDVESALPPEARQRLEGSALR